MREFRYPGAARKYWGLTVIAALGVLLWLVTYEIYLIDGFTQFGGARSYPYSRSALVQFAGEVADFADDVIPFVRVSETAVAILFIASFIVVYSLVVFLLCLVWRRRLTYLYRLDPDGLVRVGPRKESRIDFAEIRDVRVGVLRTVILRTPFEVISVPLALEGSRELLKSIKDSIAAGGGNFSEAAYQKAVDTAAFAEWKIRYGACLIASGALLAVAAGGTTYWLTDILWRRSDPVVAAGASILLLPVYIAGPWWHAFGRFRGAHRDDWRPPEPSFAFWTIFLSAVAAWSIYEAFLIVVLRR